MQNLVDSLVKYTSIMNFFLIDDDKEFQTNLFNLLENFSENISIASDGEEALEKFKLSPTKFDILFIDINLPKIHGFDLIYQIRKINPKQTICVISAYSEADIFIKCIHLGINEYLIKPIDLSQFVDIMDSMVTHILYNKQINAAQKNNKNTMISGYEAIENYLSTKNNQNPITLILCNIDHFYLINKEYGYDNGNKILEKINNILEKIALKNNIKFFRCFGDEFCFISIQNNIFNKIFINEIQSYFNEIAIDNLKSIPIYVTASFGVSHDSQVINLLPNAQIALKEAKTRNISNQICIFDNNKRNYYQLFSNLQHLFYDIKQAMNGDGVIPYYQAIIDIETKEILGYECLARVKDTKGNILLPATFIPIIKHMGLTNNLTKLMIDKCFQHMKNIQKIQIKSIHVGLNITADDLLSVDFIKFLKQKIKQYNIDPNKIVLEILEDVFLDSNPLLLFNLHVIKEIGFKLAIDDFGMQHSNLNRFDYMGFDYVKIDGHYIYDITSNTRHQAIVESLVNIAKKLNMKIIAEYVHNEETYKTIKKLGVHNAQGFYIHKPSVNMLL